MTLFAHTTTRYVLWSLLIFFLHFSGFFTLIAFLVASVSLAWSNTFFEKTEREKKFDRKWIEWLWLPILIATVAFVLSHYVF